MAHSGEGCMMAVIRVLYVDDEPDLLGIGRIFLEQSGDFTVTTIGSASAALDLLIREKFDAVVSDYQMPEMDGIAFLKQLKASGNTTPFIIFTGKGREEVVIEALNEGADFYLQKGGEPKAQFTELANKIRYAISRRCAEVDLRESEERYRNVVEDQTEFICRFLPDGTHVFVNEAYCRYFGLNQKEIIGTRFHPTIHPQDQENVVRLIASLTPDHPLMNIDQRIIMPDSSIRWQRWVDRAIFQSDGSLKEYQSVGRDITDWKRSEEALAESELFNRDLVENLPDYIVVYGPDGKILYVNPASVRVLGNSAEKLIGTPVLSYVAEEYRDIVVSRITERLSGGEVHPYEIDLLSSDGLRRSVIVKGTQVRYHGSPAILLLLIDITERKLAEVALQDNENKLDAIIRGSPIPQFVIDRDHNIINWNEALEKYSGITVEEILGTNQQWRAFYPSERPCLADLLVDGAIEMVPHWYSGKYAKSKLIENAYEATDFFPHMGESGIWLYFTAAPIHDEDGLVIGAVETLEDITERKRAEEQLRIKNTVFESSIAANSIADNLGIISSVNPAFLLIWGYKTKDDAIGKPIHSFFAHEKDAAPVLEALDTFGRWVGEFTALRVDGSTFIAFGIATAIKDETGKQIGYQSTLLDITERKRAEEALQKSEERYRNVVEDQTEFICRFLPDGTHIFVNDAYCRYFDKKQEEIIGYRFRPVLHPEDREIVARHIATLTSDHPHETIDQRIIMPDGSTRWQRWSDRAIFDPDGRIIEYQSVGWDITEQKELEKETEYHEQELQQYSTSLATANKKLNLLSSITRHDINNQLTILTGYLAFLENKQPDPTLTEYFLRVSNAAKRISAMVKFTREYEEIGVKAPIWHDCRTLVDTAAKQAPLGMVVVKNHLPAGAEVFADPLVIKVFYNLMENAVRYGGKITTIRFSAEETGEDHLIVCEDDGDGIVAAEKEKIFERGFGKNTGLGLALSREILAITGITITETGEPGKGARFEMTVPEGMWR